MESDSEAEEDNYNEEEEVVVEVEQRPPSVCPQERITERQFERIQVSHITKIQILRFFFSFLSGIILDLKQYTLELFSLSACYYVCPLDGAERMSSKAGRRAHGQTESWVKAHGGNWVNKSLKYNCFIILFQVLFTAEKKEVYLQLKQSL